MTYTRVPATGGTPMAYDGIEVVVSHADIWPHVGGFFHLWCDDPDDPDGYDQWRQSGVIVEILRLSHSGRD